MAKKITLNYNDKTYTLEYTRKSVETLERQGFNLSDIKKKPISTIPMLFSGAFLANHKFVKKDVIDRIFSKLKGKDELINTLIEMYAETMTSLMDEPEDDESEGNLTWSSSM